MTGNEMDGVFDKLKQKPDYVTEVEGKEDTYEIKTRKGPYIMEELNGTEVKSCNKISEISGVPVEFIIIRKALVEPKLTDEEVGNLKQSVLGRLERASSYIHGLADFL